MSDLKQKAEDLHDHFGSWARAARRSGLPEDALRHLVQKESCSGERYREEIEQAHRLFDMHHLVGVDAVGTCKMALSALQDTDTTDRQEQIIDRGMEILQRKMDALRLSDIDRLRDEICG